MQTITFWKQPLGKTMKRVDSDGRQHVNADAAFREMGKLKANGWSVIDHGHKVVCTIK